MVRAVAAGAFADREPILEHPDEVARGDALGPLALHRCHVTALLVVLTCSRGRFSRRRFSRAGSHAAGAGAPIADTASTALTVAATSCTRTMATPRHRHHTAVATDPS